MIVGAGTAGCILANRLSDDPGNRVLLLEAGGRDANPLFKVPAGFALMTKGVASWGWSTVPQRSMNGRSIWFTQAKVLGGGSSINAQIYCRGNARDFDGWAGEHGCEGWSYREVLPYFIRAEDNETFSDGFHGSGGPIGVSNPRAALPICEAFLEAACQYGLERNPDFNGAKQDGVGFYQLTQRNARRSSTASEYLRPALGRPNLEVRTRAQARRILFDGCRAIGVELSEAGRPAVARATREVALCAGAVGSPRLLLLSGVGPADHLKSVNVDVAVDLPGVGANLHDHINLCVVSECSGRHSYDGCRRFDRAALAGLRYLLFRNGPAAASLFETGGFCRADGASGPPDIQIHLGQGSGIEKGIAKLGSGGVTLNSGHIKPKSRGTVRLASGDPFADPLIDPNYWGEPGDLDKSLKGLDIVREIMRQPALAPFVRGEALPGRAVVGREELFAYACSMAKTDHHPVGTCRMGAVEGAVVSPRLEVFGAEGLRVCDASVMPEIVAANTNAATMMIAEKASDLLLGRPPLPPAGNAP